MAIKTKDEILASIKEKFAEDSSDETLGFIEDISDTLDDYENKVKGDGKDWKAEAKRIDDEWREKYKARFFSGSKNEEPEEDEDLSDEIKPKKFEDLFTTKE